MLQSLKNKASWLGLYAARNYYKTPHRPCNDTDGGDGGSGGGGGENIIDDECRGSWERQHG